MSLDPQNRSAYDFLICRNQENDTYQLYRFDCNASNPFAEIPLAKNLSFDRTYQIAQVGGFLLQWGPLCEHNGKPSYHFNLLNFDPTDADPLNAEPLQTGYWEKKKLYPLLIGY